MDETTRKFTENKQTLHNTLTVLKDDLMKSQAHEIKRLEDIVKQATEEVK